MIPMQSMELDDDEILDTAMPIAMDAPPKYPYGLRICLTQDEFDKLGLDPEEAEVGATVLIQAVARITDYSHHEDENGVTCRCELQIEDMGVVTEDDPAEEAAAEKPPRGPASFYKTSMASS